MMTNNQTIPEAIRVLITDDHAIVREGLRTLIGTEPGMQVIGEAADGLEAVRLVCQLKPDHRRMS
jgi:YesN/AraC family two-component response regulator